MNPAHPGKQGYLLTIPTLPGGTEFIGVSWARPMSAHRITSYINIEIMCHDRAKVFIIYSNKVTNTWWGQIFVLMLYNAIWLWGWEGYHCVSDWWSSHWSKLFFKLSSYQSSKKSGTPIVVCGTLKVLFPYFTKKSNAGNSFPRVTGLHDQWWGIFDQGLK